MRLRPWCFVLIGCGPVELGEELRPAAGDGGQAEADAGLPQVVVTIRARDACCFELTAAAHDGQPPYEFEWTDGSLGAERVVCPEAGAAAFSVFAMDANGARSPTHVALLELADGGCPPAPDPNLLQLENPSFEGTAAVNTGSVFDCPSWSACSLVPNTPDVVNSSIPQFVVALPAPAEGTTFLGLMEDEQASQTLSKPLAAGSSVSLQLSLGRLYIGAGVVPDTELPFLEIWGGASADCSQQELLWRTLPLELGWHEHCVTLRPTQFMDQLTLQARTDQSLGSQAYLVVDHLVPVSACP